MRDERERMLSQVDFVNCLKEKLSPAKIEAPRQSETEKKLLEEIGGLRKEWKEKERKEEMAAAVAKARAEGIKEGRGKRALGRENMEVGYGYGNSGAYASNRAMPDISTTFLAGVGAATLSRNSRPRSRSRSRSRERHRERPVYMLETDRRRGRRDSIEEICGGVGKLNDRMRRMEGKFDADFDRGMESLRVVTGGYGGRWS